MKKVNVLDKGYVIIHEDGVMGSDKTIANAARVSYQKRTEDLTQADERLISFLAREGHTSPFRHATLQFEVRCPLMIARQWWKYVVGSGFQDPMVAWNESSRRYVTEENEYHLPIDWRSKPSNSKQGSGENIPFDKAMNWTALLDNHQKEGERLYQLAMQQGIAPEQARLFTPSYGLYVTFYWTASVQGVAHLIKQRTKQDAQYEFQLFANAVKDLAEEHFPIAIKELLK